MKNVKIIGLLLGTALLATACGGGGGSGGGQEKLTPQQIYDATYTTAKEAKATNYQAKTVAAIKASHARGWTGNGVTIATVDNFASGATHGDKVKIAIDTIAPSATGIEVNIGTGSTSISIDTGFSGANGQIVADADIFNLSSSRTYRYSHSQARVDAFTIKIEALNLNNLAVIAAGNYSASCTTLGYKCNVIPQSFLDAGVDTIVVGALTADGKRLASYSNKAGVYKDNFIAAPVWAGSGTSFAAPIVAATAALIMDKFNNTNAGSAKNIIFNTADDLGVAGVDSVYGHGALNVGAALSPVGNLR